MIKKSRVFSLVFLVILLSLSLFILAKKVENPKVKEDTKSILQKKLEEGEAYIWHLGHSGWAIKTQNHFLVFDYIKMKDTPAGAGLADGAINPDEIKGQNIFVFVSHGHGDHYDEAILNWEKEIPGITYIWGWPENKGSHQISMEMKREKKEIAGMKVYTIWHKFDNIPESAFLIDLGGLVLFHSGDHGNGPPPLRKKFTDNIDYLAGISSNIDIIFLPLWGEEFYPIQTLKPKVMFPMHEGRNISRYAEWAKGAQKKYENSQISYAEQEGDCFYYKSGKITKF
jgi:L-ascorbate metabolism protein UlaG (beta-lactamase superfamily)